MTDIEELIATMKAEALAAKLYSTPEADWRYFCRQYSIKFSTPLREVLLMEPEHVILNVFESQTDELNVVDQIDTIMERIYSIEDPEYDAKQAKKLEEQDRLDEMEEEERQRLNKPLHKSLAGKSPFSKPPPKPVEPEKEMPPEKSSGFIDLSYLSKEEES